MTQRDIDVWGEKVCEQVAAMIDGATQKATQAWGEMWGVPEHYVTRDELDERLGETTAGWMGSLQQKMQLQEDWVEEQLSRMVRRPPPQSI